MEFAVWRRLPFYQDQSMIEHHWQNIEKRWMVSMQFFATNESKKAWVTAFELNPKMAQFLWKRYITCPDMHVNGPLQTGTINRPKGWEITWFQTTDETSKWPIYLLFWNGPFYDSTFFLDGQSQYRAKIAYLVKPESVTVISVKLDVLISTGWKNFIW